MPAKRNANDRNKRALEERKNGSQDVFVTKNGLKINLRKIDLWYVQHVSNSIEMPEVPTYKVQVGFKGREEEYPLDAEVAKELPEYGPIWRKYIRDRNDALSRQSELVMRAMFHLGTEQPNNWYDPEWERQQRIIGIKLPSEQDELWLEYLISILDQEEKEELLNAITKLSGVSEEMIREAEESFLDSLQDESGESADLEGSEPDPERASEE